MGWFFDREFLCAATFKLSQSLGTSDVPHGRSQPFEVLVSQFAYYIEINVARDELRRVLLQPIEISHSEIVSFGEIRDRIF